MAALVAALHAFPSTEVLNMKNVEVAYILGTGFSTDPGLPIQSDSIGAPLPRVSRMLQREYDVASKSRGGRWSRLTRFFNPDPEFHSFTKSD